MTITIACAFDMKGLDVYAKATPDHRIADIMILPELCDGGYARLHREKGASADVTRLQERCATLSRQHNMSIVAGSMALPDESGQVLNSSVVYSRGDQLGRFDKVHLFRPLGDDQFFAPGVPRPTVAFSAGDRDIRLGVMICYDLRFPELARPWFKSGVDLIAIPARWPRVRDDLWKALLKARAIENQCFVVGVDSRDSEGGGTYAYGPDGVEQAALGPDPVGSDPQWLSFEIDLDDIMQVKDRLDTRLDACLL